MVTNPELDDLDLGSVIDAVKSASADELAKLTEISSKLDGAPTRTGAPIVQAELDTKKVENAVKSGVENATIAVNQKPKRKNSRRNRPVAQTTTRTNEVQLDLSAPEVATQAQPTPAPVNRIADNPEPEPQQQAPEKKERTKTPTATGDVTVSVEPPAPVFERVDSLDDMPDKVEQAVKDGLSGFDGYWKDTAGKLRRKDGKYASKQETQAYNAAEVANQRQQEQIGKSNDKQVGLFAQFAGTLKEFTKDRVKASMEQDNDATDAAGAAAGGSFFYSAKEMYNLSQETREAFEDAKQSVTESGTRDAIAASKIGKLFGIKSSSEKAESEHVETTANEPAESATVSSDVSRTESLQSASEARTESDRQGVTESSVNRTSNQSGADVRDSNRSTQKVTNNERTTATDTTIASVERTDSSNLVSHTGERVRDTESTNTTASDKSSSERVTQSQVATQVNNTSQIDKAKDSQYKAEQLEVLKEQSAERKDMVNEIVDKLDEVKTAAASAGGNGGGGLMDLAGDLFDRRGRKRGRAGRGGKAGKLRSIFSKGAGAGAGGIASKGMSMAGGAFKGLSKLGGIAGKAVPFLAPALMAYDAFSGFTDTERQQETFNLKDGQEATTGQKSSMALASVLDMGGLVSGGAGLIGSALGALGFDGAQEALSFDSGDMARGIYGMFGGDTPEKEPSKPVAKPDPEKEREYSANAVEYKQADKFERESMEREADPQRLTTERVKERSQETGKSFGYTYKRMSREREQQKQERQKIADEMGIDISGKVEHPDLGTMYSPQKKGDQLKIVEQELSRRREVESLAKQGDFRNGRFIGSEPKGYMTSLNTKVAAEQQQKANAQAALDAQDFSLTPAAVTPLMANAESSVRGNERVSDIRSQQQDKAFRDGEKSQSVKLDEESIKKLARGGSSHSSTTIIQKGNKTKEATAPAKPTGSIPNNFSDRSLQRQSADLE
ncbi:hypothetical protein [Vibrio harveyi]|uniref:Uncharacterized protein n=1 Tax=Vibrio harveyi TaxID=669 RepID=A0A8B3DMH6_VIBHA|nr:hypothetical protein [Vibrio harveyi]RIW17882.1 hypothetical protein DS957_003710 [Vibrio harveyi]